MHDKPCPYHKFWMTCKIDLQMARHDGESLFKLIILCKLQVKILKNDSFPQKITFKLVYQGNNLEKK